MTRSDACRMGIRLLGIYFCAQGILALGYTLNSYVTAIMMTTDPASPEYTLLTRKSLPGNLIYPIVCGLAGVVLLAKARAITEAFDKSDRNADGEPTTTAAPSADR